MYHFHGEKGKKSVYWGKDIFRIEIKKDRSTIKIEFFFLDGVCMGDSQPLH